MGMQFPLRYTNLVAYFTTDLPDIEAGVDDLRGFFSMLQTDEWRLLTSAPDDRWPNAIRSLAGASLEVLARKIKTGDEVTTDLREARFRVARDKTSLSLDKPVARISEVFSSNREILEQLHLLFRGLHEVFVLGVASGAEDAQKVNQFLRDLLYGLRDSPSMLFLLPDAYFEGPLDFLDPFPGASKMCASPERWPGVLLWNKFGVNLFLPLPVASSLLRATNFLSFFAGQRSRDVETQIESAYMPPQSARRHIRILHLSDLHFGTDYAARNQDYLLAVIQSELRGKFDRIVITGDLFDSVWARKWRAFESFRTNLRLLTTRDPIVIPGNHDMRIAGNRLWRFGESYRYVSQLGGTPIYADTDLQCLFFCFNSARGGNFARGEVIEDDLIASGTEYQVLAGRNPEISDWLRVALVHHHPFKFDTAAESMTARLLEVFGIPEGDVVDMDKSERFVQWCANRGIQLILHGHRHVQRKISQLVPVQIATALAAYQVTAIGCGTSLGAEGYPKSFNLITWDHRSQRWSAAFYLDQSGGGFKQVRVTSTTADPSPPI